MTLGKFQSRPYGKLTINDKVECAIAMGPPFEVALALTCPTVAAFSCPAELMLAVEESVTVAWLEAPVALPVPLAEA